MRFRLRKKCGEVEGVVVVVGAVGAVYGGGEAECSEEEEGVGGLVGEDVGGVESHGAGYGGGDGYGGAAHTPVLNSCRLFLLL